MVFDVVGNGLNGTVDDDLVQLTYKNTVLGVNSQGKLFQVFISPKVDSVNCHRSI